ncbi:hypothetical protein FBEOM_7628 [Fusarium beomiforme]|uniref:Transcription factor n=1 Tax=Fusarium beomiforme TaxID=44412 RepID=A0A9P5AHK3_9HYPO|nr:hypothetical protein FBEOM_7628 [Fusarium beomiforme]
MQSFQQERPNSFCKLVKTFDAGFPMGNVESALSFVDESMQSGKVGAVSKCIVWLCLSFKELPPDFRNGEAQASLLRPNELIDRCIAKVEALYQANSTPACNIDFVQALILQHELFVSIGRPKKAWKCIRAGIENGLLLGLHHGRSSLERGVWEELWMRDRQLSLFLGLPHAVPENLAAKKSEDKYSNPEKEAFRKIATVSGLIIERNQMGRDTPYLTITRILEEMKNLKEEIPQHWGTKEDLEDAFCLSQVFIHANIRLLYHALELMIHLPYSQIAKQEKDLAYTRKATMEAAEAIIKSHEDMRALEVKPYVPMRVDFLDFLGFKAALVLAEDLLSEKNSRAAEEAKRLWNLIINLAFRLRGADEAFSNSIAKQAAATLEVLHGASEGVLLWSGTYQVTIPYFGRLKICEVTEEAQQHTRRHQDSGPKMIVVEMESNYFTFGVPNEQVTELELAADWMTEVNSALEYDWKGIYEFDMWEPCLGNDN